MVGDLYSILFGTGYIATKLVEDSTIYAKNASLAERQKARMDKLTDVELERKLRLMVEDPEYYDEIWETLEMYKRDNPLRCKRLENKERVCFEQTFPPYPGWQDVGRTRLEFWDSYGYMFKSLISCNDKYRKLDQNRDGVVKMLLSICGKRAYREAHVAVYGARTPVPFDP